MEYQADDPDAANQPNFFHLNIVPDAVIYGSGIKLRHSLTYL